MARIKASAIKRSPKAGAITKALPVTPPVKKKPFAGLSRGLKGMGRAIKKLGGK